MPPRHLQSRSFLRASRDISALPARMGSQKFGRGLLTRIVHERGRSTHSQLAGAILMQGYRATPEKYRACVCQPTPRVENRNILARLSSQLCRRSLLAFSLLIRTAETDKVI